MAVPKSFSGHFADVVVLKKLFGEDATKASIPRNYIINVLQLYNLQQAVSNDEALGPAFAALLTKAAIERRFNDHYRVCNMTVGQKVKQKADKTKKYNEKAERDKVASAAAKEAAEVKRQREFRTTVEGCLMRSCALSANATIVSRSCSELQQKSWQDVPSS